MAKAGLDKNSVIIKAAELANKNGLGSLSMKELAQSAGVQPPSLYNHIGSLAELQRELMLFGWREMEPWFSAMDIWLSLTTIMRLVPSS